MVPVVTTVVAVVVTVAAVIAIATGVVTAVIETAVVVAVAVIIAVETTTADLTIAVMVAAAVVIAGTIGIDTTTAVVAVVIIVETTGTVAAIIAAMTGTAVAIIAEIAGTTGTVVHPETEAATVAGLVVAVARVRHQDTDAVVRGVHHLGNNQGTMIATVVTVATVVEVVRETTGVGRRSETFTAVVIIGATGAVDTVLEKGTQASEEMRLMCVYGVCLRDFMNIQKAYEGRSVELVG
jgi:hypothetical protein